MTYLERTTQRVHLLPFLAALAVATSFAFGIVVGGPVLHLGSGAAPALRVNLTDAERAAGRAWELQRIQQGAHRATVGVGAGTSTAVRAGGEAWEAERRDTSR